MKEERENRMRIVFYTLLVLLATVLQPTLIRGLAIGGIAPDLFLCLTVLTGFFRGKTEGGVCGAIFGLFYDILIGRMIGVSALCFLYLGFGAGFLSEGFFSGHKRLAATVVTVAGTLLVALVYGLVRLAVHGDLGLGTAIFRIGFPEAVYNGVLTFLLSFPVSGLMKWMGIRRIY